MLSAFVYIVLVNFPQKFFELNNCVPIIVSNPKFKGVELLVEDHILVNGKVLLKFATRAGLSLQAAS